jgi:CheY-like chemotaxis protein
MTHDAHPGLVLGGKTRALVVDDDPILRSIVKSRLRTRVDEIVEASDGLTAWRLLTNESFDVALVDLMMPGLNGFALIQCMRGHPRTRHMPIVVVTSSDDRASVERALEVGASAFLTKPVSWSVFDTHMAHLMRLAAASRSAELALSRNRNLLEAQAAFAAAGAAIAHAAFRRLSRAIERPSASVDASAIAREIASAQKASDHLRALACMVARPELIDGASHPVTAVLAAIRGLARGEAEGLSIDIVEAPEATTEIVCNLEALATAGLACARAASVRDVPARLEIRAAEGSEGLDIEIRATRATRAGCCESDLDIDLAIAAQLPEGSATCDIAMARTLLAAHGGSLRLALDESAGPAILLRLPLDRLRVVAPRRTALEAL